MIVTPSILTNSARDIEQQVTRLLPYFNYFQIDIADGQFVNNTTVSLNELKAFLQDNPYSLMTGAHYDFHLMVVDYKSALEELKIMQTYLTIHNVFIHIKLEPNYPLLRWNYRDFTIGLVFNPEDDVQYFRTIYPLNTIDIVQVMSVNPGMQGGSFIQESLQKFTQLRDNGYKSKILLDGGINSQTLPVILHQAAPDGIGPGSYLSKAENLAETVAELENLCITEGISPILKVE